MFFRCLATEEVYYSGMERACGVMVEPKVSSWEQGWGRLVPIAFRKQHRLATGRDVPTPV